jgi:hypothetical protein
MTTMFKTSFTTLTAFAFWLALQGYTLAATIHLT